MNIKIIVFILILFATIISAQTEYEVVPDTKNNQVTLSVVNESKSLNVDKVKVTLTNKPKGIEICCNIVEVGSLKIGEEKETLFSFDAKRIPGAKKDTLRFLITDNYGNSWKKEIAIKYALPKEFKMEQNYPNPFNPTTTINYAIQQPGMVVLKVYNIVGQEIQTLVNGYQAAGKYQVTLNADYLSSGVYFYRLQSSGNTSMRKMVLLR